MFVQLHHIVSNIQVPHPYYDTQSLVLRLCPRRRSAFIQFPILFFLRQHYWSPPQPPHLLALFIHFLCFDFFIPWLTETNLGVILQIVIHVLGPIGDDLIAIIRHTYSDGCRQDFEDVPFKFLCLVLFVGKFELCVVFLSYDSSKLDY